MSEEKDSGNGPAPGVDVSANHNTSTNTNTNTPPNAGERITRTDNDRGMQASAVDQSNYAKNYAATPLSPSTYNPHLQPTYYYQHAPPSPATPSMGNGYDVQSLLGQHSGVGNVFLRQPYPVIPPLSPGEPGNNSFIEDVNLSMGTVPPASPLFPGTIPVFGATSEQLGSGRSMVTPTSPSLQYLTGPPPSPVISYGGVYPNNINIQSGSPEAHSSWSDRPLEQQHMYPSTTPTPSPHIQSLQYQQSMNQSRRTTSFDGGDLLPPSALEDSGSAVYATSGGATLFSQQQPWGYNPAANNPYGNAPPSSLQQHPHMRGSPQRGGRQPGRGHGAQPFFPAATPGPPIQTTHHNKGPEGANLFIFHIPNHFTNLDMWHLFCHYGNLLSVRIMVEKDTGRSRGFGFVSYDSPDAAALAIKELNGFVVSAFYV